MSPDNADVWIVDASGTRREVVLDACLDPEAVEASEREANAWIKRLRDVPLDGVPLRRKLTYRGDSLWWFLEIYLHKQRTVASAFRAVHALERLVETEKPRALGVGAGGLYGLLARQVAARHGLRCVLDRPGRMSALPGHVRLLARGRFHTLTAWLDRVRPGAAKRAPRLRVGQGVRVAAFVHSAFWRQDRAEEGYIGPVLQALERRLPPGDIALVGLGPRTNFRTRGWRHRFAEFNDPQARALPLVPIEALAGRRAIRPSMGVWRERSKTFRLLESSEALRQASTIAGYDLWPLVREDLAGVAHLQLPWSARAMDEAGAALDALQPQVVVTYAEAGGWGRALVLEARRRDIPVVGLQHGFIYRHWLNYLHEPDEMAPAGAGDRGFPRPDLTLVYDGFARQHLLEAGHFPPDSVVVTGSPRLETFLAAGARLTAADRKRIRSGAGARDGQKLVVVAAKHSQMGSWFEALVRAIAGVPEAHVAVKCHPAETTEPYERAAGAAPNVRVLGAGTDLADLVACADLLVTINSTAALEAMALDVPALVLSLPNNLSPFVDAGALAGVGDRGEIAAALRRLLYDQVARQQLTQCRRAFVERYGMVSTGGAAERAADAILGVTTRS